MEAPVPPPPRRNQQLAEERPRPSLQGTEICVLLSLPLLIWFVSLAVRSSDQTPPQCDALLRSDPSLAIGLYPVILIMLIVQIMYAFYARRWFALGGFILISFSFILLFAFAALRVDLPDFGDKPAIHYSSKPPGGVVFAQPNNNISHYFHNNVKACPCKDQDCEDTVYRYYMVDLHNDDGFFKGVDFPFYTRVADVDDDDEVKKRHGRPATAHGPNGTSPPRNGDSRYHKVCYSSILDNKANKTRLCYECYACEEKYLRGKQTMIWKFSNHLLVASLLLILSNLVMFLSQSWARYVTWEGALPTDENPPV